MSEKQRLKHIADREPKPFAEGSSLDASEPTPDRLGEWQGGIQKSPTFGLRAKPQRTGDIKNTPGIDYPSKITHRQDRDFNEVHVEENGDVLLYNVKTDAWDIKGDSADIPYYEDSRGWLWGYNVHTGAWDVPVETQEYI